MPPESRLIEKQDRLAWKIFEISLHRVSKKERPKVLGYNTAKNVFKNCIRVHIDHKYPTFDKMHQDSLVYHFEIHSEV